MNKTQFGSVDSDPAHSDVTTYQEARWSILIPKPFHEAVRKYESLVPGISREAVNGLVQAGAPWDDVLADMRERAPHGFVLYFRMAVDPIMALAGDNVPCNLYLMGNHTIAQRAFHHDPSVMLSVPLRVVVHADSADPLNATRLVIDQPGVRLASHGNPAITQVGEELDQKVDALLALLRG